MNKKFLATQWPKIALQAQIMTKPCISRGAFQMIVFSNNGKLLGS